MSTPPSPPPPAELEPETDASARLPTDVVPLHYTITLRTDLARRTFDGLVAVRLRAARATAALVLHAAPRLAVGAATLLDKRGGLQPEAAREVDAARSRLTLRFAKPLQAGAHAELVLPFQGRLADAMDGYYANVFRDGDRDVCYSASFLAPISARAVFPCWDEPAIKATFEVRMLARVGTASLSNMPALHSVPVRAAELRFLGCCDDPADWTITHFATTPKMSTYLLAFANGPFECLESAYTSPLSGIVRPLRMYATPDLIDQCRFALEVKTKVLPIYERMFKLEYPLPKLDTLVARTAQGGMENWGLIIGGPDNFCVDAAAPDAAQQRVVARVQAHEVAHQWFGNIVTMQWWNDTWLNEGFPDLVACWALDRAYPAWGVRGAFFADAAQPALALDARRGSHPVDVPVPSEDVINQVFDALSYNKASAVLGMLAAHVGEATFLDGVGRYLRRHVYANTVSADLWDALAEAAGADVEALMRPWLTQTGYPVLTVARTPDGISVRQDRLLEGGGADDAESTLWPVPLGIRSSESRFHTPPRPALVLTAREQTFALRLDGPFKLNASAAGFFRVLYAPALFAEVAAEAARPDSAFDARDAAGLVSDALALGRAGLAPGARVLELAQALRHSPDYNVLNGVAGALSTLAAAWAEHPRVATGLRLLQQHVFAPIVARLGYDQVAGEPSDARLLRSTAVAQAAAAGEPDVVGELFVRFWRFVGGAAERTVPPDLVRLTFITVVRYAGAREFEAVRRLAETSEDYTVRSHARRAMGATIDDDLLLASLQNGIDTGVQDIILLLLGAQTSHRGRVTAWWLAHNIDTLADKYAFLLKVVVEFALRGLTSMREHDALAAFFARKDTSRYRLALEPALEAIRIDAAWIANLSEEMERWLEEWQGSG